MFERSRSWMFALLAVASLAVVSCVPNPPPPPPPDPVPTVLTVSPETVELHPGESQQLTAEVLDQDGEAMPSVTVTWTSDAPEVADVSSTGLVAADAVGSATITAAVGGLSATADIAVVAVPNTAPVISIINPDGEVSVNEVDVIDLAAVASDTEDGDLSSEIAWSVLADGGTPVELGTGPTAEAGPLAPGSYTFTASVTDSGGLTASTQVQATVAECVLTALILPYSGNKDAGPLHLDASVSTDSCDRPLYFSWFECRTTGDPVECQDFLMAGDGGRLEQWTFDLGINVQMRIGLELCAEPLLQQNCAVIQRIYTGLEPF